MNQAAARLRAWGAGITAVGAKIFALGALVKAPLEVAQAAFVSMGGEVLGASKRTGIAVEQMSALGFAASQSGSDIQELATDIFRFQDSISKAAGGSKEMAQAFARLGIDAHKLVNQGGAEQFLALAEGLKKVGNQAERVELAKAVGGRGIAGILPFLQKGKAGIEELTAKAEALGLVMSAADAQAASAFGKEMKSLWAQAKMLSFHLGGAVVPALRDFLATVRPAVTATVQWAKEHRPLVALVGRMAGVAVAAGAATMVLGRAVSLAAPALTLLSRGLGLARVGLGLTARGLSLVASAAPLAWRSLEMVGRAALFVVNPLNLARAPAAALRATWAALSAVRAGGGFLAGAVKSLANPYVLLGAAVVAAAAGLGYLALKSDAGQAALAKLHEVFPALKGAAGAALDYTVRKFGELKDTALTAWSGISAAVESGDLWGAFNIGILAAKVAWYQLTEDLAQPWADFTAGVQSAWAETSAWLEGQMVTVKVYWSELTGFLGEEWAKLTGYLGKVWAEWAPTVTAAANAVWGELKAEWQVLKDVWSGTVNFMSDLWAKWSDRIVAGLRPVLVALSYVNPAAAAALKALDALKDSDTGKNLQQHLQNAADRINGPEADQARQDIEGEKNKRLDDIETTRQGAGDAHKQRLRELQAELAAAAETAKAARDAGKKPPKGAESLGGGAGAFQGAIKADVIGTFSGLAAERLGGGGDAAGRTAANTQKANELLKQLVKLADGRKELAFV